MNKITSNDTITESNLPSLIMNFQKNETNNDPKQDYGSIQMYFQRFPCKNIYSINGKML